MLQLWKERDLPGVVSGITPTLIPKTLDELYASKGREIKAWISQHPATQYVILDDVPDFLPEQESHYIEINPLLPLLKRICPIEFEIV